MSSRLTGRIQHRVVCRMFDKPVLVLQVEEDHEPYPDGPYGKIWRDATAEDLAHLPRLYDCNLKEKQ